MPPSWLTGASLHGKRRNVVKKQYRKLWEAAVFRDSVGLGLSVNFAMVTLVSAANVSFFYSATGSK